MRLSDAVAALAALTLLTSACGGSSPPASSVDAGEDVTHATDLPQAGETATPLDTPTATDLPAALDGPVADVTTFDAALDDHSAVADAEVVDAPDAGCTSDLTCARSAEGPVCDTTTGRCVRCTPSTDRCPAGQYCVPEMNRCAPGCRADTECSGSTPSCDLSTHTCVTCLSSGDCALSAVCIAGRCVPSCGATGPCEAPQTCCSLTCADLQTNVEHCGSCSTRCTPANAMPVCTAGVCGMGACLPPYADCDGVPANGCEVNTASNVAHCGGCDRACPPRANSTATCAAGTCSFTCAAGFADCNGDATDGCEVDLTTTPSHCGACGRSCSLPNATAGCSLGACVITGCAAGYGDCNTNPADGCEVDLRTSLSHCGGCGQRCAPAAAYPVCSAGVCRLVGCEENYGDCDRSATNGCEVLLSSPTNCGFCGITCPAATGPHTVSRCAPSSSTYACGLACESGWVDCDGSLTNGCEAMGACTRTREVLSDTFMTGAGNWSFPGGSGGASFGLTTQTGSCRNPTFCFGCDACLAASGYCGSFATARLNATFDFSRVISGIFSFYSNGSPGASDRFILQASSDGGSTWRSLSTPPPSTSSLNTASPQLVDLTPIAGASTIQFRFLFENNCDPGDTFGIGWRIDDVRIVLVERTY